MLVLNARAFGFLNAPLVGAARRGFRGGAAAPTLGLSRRGGALHGARSASDFTTSELKRLLGERGIDFRDCLEKRELVERLQDALRGGDGLSGGAASAMGQLDAGERSVVELFQRVAPSVAFIQTSVAGQQKGDSTSLQRECSARARFGNSTHASRALREMIARPKISRNERKTTERGAFEVGQCRTRFPPRSARSPC